VGAELGFTWPPTSLVAIQPFEVPLLNTLILLRSGVTVTWAHHRLAAGGDRGAKAGLLLTILLGAYFRAIQGGEYLLAPFSI
jgi:heme/copper-type cytochrome/quinol oxidase subunit 3